MVVSVSDWPYVLNTRQRREIPAFVFSGFTEMLLHETATTADEELHLVLSIKIIFLLLV
ncbi:hypothetical protein HDC92_004117 [Pedobacter sp. AK017]|uniref:hypothetical protein n=1 Tax=Pedobacter sp. AK017 TaxID=2723073 RepID=UPI00019EC9E8|nr:hypothetical protein [Pedobacter sp. AK017]MBB5440416.1 hypothetical protein [Pedobacter sp. AK017]